MGCCCHREPNPNQYAGTAGDGTGLTYDLARYYQPATCAGVVHGRLSVLAAVAVPGREEVRSPGRR